MNELYTDIEINASADRVWQILTDLPAYRLWNPFIRRASGEIRTGARLDVFMQPGATRGMTFKPTLLNVEPGRELRWLGQLLMPGIFDGEHIFSIEPLDGGGVRFVQREKFKGLLVPLLKRRLNRDTRAGFVEMNQALKERAEGEMHHGGREETEKKRSERG